MTDTIAREERPAGPLTLIADRAAIRNFLRRPEAGYTLEAKASIPRRGQRSILTEVTVNSKGRTQPMAHAVVAYAIVGSDRDARPLNHSGQATS